MIRSFKHKGLRLLFEKGDRRRLPRADIERIENILFVLDRAAEPEDADLPGFRLHPLKGALRGTWSVTVRANWRIVFRMDDGDVHDVDFVDYHSEAIVPMKKPPHPGRVVRQECLEPLGLSVTNAAEHLGVNRNTLNNLVNERSGISPEMAVRLSKAFGGRPRMWLGLQMDHDLAQAEAKSDSIDVERIERPNETSDGVNAETSP